MKKNMNKNTKKIMVPVVITLIIMIFVWSIFQLSNYNSSEVDPINTPSASADITQDASEAPDIDVDYDLSDYFMYKEDAVYVYSSEENELYNQEHFLTFKDGNSIQWKILVPEGDFEITNVADISDNGVNVVYAESNTKIRENIIGKEVNSDNLVLQGPLEIGHTWSNSNGSVSEIKSLNSSVELSFGNFEAIEVDTNKSNGDFRKDFYVRDIGLVKTMYSYTEMGEVTCTLTEIRENTPLNLEIDRFDYVDETGQNEINKSQVEITFNPDYLTALENNLKQSTNGTYMPLLTENTKINSITKEVSTDEKLVLYVDLSKEFISEQNLGASFESALLDTLVDTLGNFYGTEQVSLTIDGGAYESGHILLDKPMDVTVIKKEQ